MILCKDFASVLAMHRDTRGTVLAALREIYDGAWVRHVGVDGGRTLAWSGKVALIAGCTPTIDSHHAVMAAMGERFMLYRLPPVAETNRPGGPWRTRAGRQSCAANSRRRCGRCSPG